MYKCYRTIFSILYDVSRLQYYCGRILDHSSSKGCFVLARSSIKLSSGLQLWKLRLHLTLTAHKMRFLSFIYGAIHLNSLCCANYQRTDLATLFCY